MGTTKEQFDQSIADLESAFLIQEKARAAKDEADNTLAAAQDSAAQANKNHDEAVAARLAALESHKKIAADYTDEDPNT